MTFLPFQWLTISACPLEDDNQKFLQTAIFGCAFEPMNWATVFFFGRIKSASEANEETNEQNKHKQVSSSDNEKKKCSPKLAENHLLAFIGPKSLPAHAGGRVEICLTSCKTMPATGGWQRAKKRKSSRIKWPYASGGEEWDDDDDDDDGGGAGPWRNGRRAKKRPLKMVNVVLSLPSPVSPLLELKKRRRNLVCVCVCFCALSSGFVYFVVFCPEGWGALIHSHLSEILCFARSRARILASGCDMNNYYFGRRMEIKDLKRMAGSATAGWDRKRCGLLSASCWLSGDSLLARVSIIVGLGEYTNSTNFLPSLGEGPAGGMKKTLKTHKQVTQIWWPMVL